MVETLEGLSSVNFPKHKDPVYPQDQIEQMITNAITQAGESSWFFKKTLTFIVTKVICQVINHEMNKPNISISLRTVQGNNITLARVSADTQ